MLVYKLWSCRKGSVDLSIDFHGTVQAREALITNTETHEGKRLVGICFKDLLFC